LTRWRKSGNLERQLHDQRPQPATDLVDSITRDVDGSRRRSSTRHRPVLAVAATAVMLIVVASFGGVGRAADSMKTSVNTAVSFVSGTSSSNVHSNSNTSGAQCDVDVPCGFKVNPTATANHMSSTQVSQDADNKVHIIPGSFNGAVSLTYTVTNTCGGSNAGVSLAFADNPIPAGQNFTGFTITTSGAANGVYTLTVIGTSGSETESGTATLIVGVKNHC
jgi:hypothetical protein